MTERSDTANSFETTLSAQMGTTDLTALVNSKGSLSSPCILVIEPDDDTQREFILFDGTFGALSFVTLSSANRCLPGSAESYPPTNPHPVNSVVSSIITQQHLEHIWTAIEGHVGGTDVADHPEVTTSIRGFMSASDKTHLDDIVSGDEVQLVHGGFNDDTIVEYNTLGLHDVFYKEVSLPAEWNSAGISVYFDSYVALEYDIGETPPSSEATIRAFATNDGGSRIYLDSSEDILGIGFPWSYAGEGNLSNPGTTTRIGVEVDVDVLCGNGKGVEFRDGNAHWIISRIA